MVDYIGALPQNFAIAKPGSSVKSKNSTRYASRKQPVAKLETSCSRLFRGTKNQGRLVDSILAGHQTAAGPLDAGRTKGTTSLWQLFVAQGGAQPPENITEKIKAHPLLLKPHPVPPMVLPQLIVEGTFHGG
jgi:hypothetical protein